MRLAFAGTPEFSVAALESLHAAGHDLAGVFTQPDRPAGRGRKLTASAVAQRAEALGLPVFKPEKFREPAQQQLRELQADLMVVVAYGLILPQAALDIPRHGCFNIHASLLPRWRGAAPIQRAIEAGDAETGITIMQMDAGLDTGPMLLRESLPLDGQTTAAKLHDALQGLGARMIVQAVDLLERGQLIASPQPEAGATYAKKLDKGEARIGWTESADLIARRIRAFNPAPGAWAELGGERVRLLNAIALHSGGGMPGQIASADSAGIRVSCGTGSVQLIELQFAGGKPLSAAQALQGRELVGRRFS